MINENQETFEKIIKQFNENINSHVFLIETNDKIKSLELIKQVIKEIIKGDEITSYQIDAESYLELSIIRSEGKEILIDQIKYLLNKIKTKPILSKYMFYVITDAEKLSLNSSNKLLKTVEEPEDGIVGFLITNNIEKILPTIKSRCEIVKNYYKLDLKEMDSNLILECSKLVLNLEKKDFFELLQCT